MQRQLPAEEGQALIELIVALALASLFLSTFVFGIITIREAFNRADNNVSAKLFLQKEVEALRSVKEKAWTSFYQPGTYHIEQNNNGWGVVAGTLTESGFTHGFTVENVCRTFATSLPVGCNLSGAVSDPSIKRITVTVSWSFLGTESVNTSFYLTRHFDDQVWTQTTLADFNGGTRVNTVVTNTSGGEVQLATPSGGNWNSPRVIATRKVGGNTAANSVFVAYNKAYVVTNSQAGADFFIYDVTNPANPVYQGGFDLGGTGYKVVVSCNYAYIATSNASRELTILDVSNPFSPTLAGFFNAPGNIAGKSVDVAGTNAFLVTNNNTSTPGYEFYSLNVSNPASPIQVGGLNLGASANSIKVMGNYAYIASTSNTEELQIVNISNPARPTLAGTYNAAGISNANSVFVINNAAYLANNRLNILNVTNPSSVSLTGSYSSSGIPHGVFVYGNFAFLAHTQNNSQFKVINIANPARPTLYGSANLGGQGNAVFVVGDYAYLATGNSNAQFQVIRGGTPGLYDQYGTFESTTIGLLSPAGFNSITATTVKPPGTTLRLQIATNKDSLTWYYVGPDGTNNTYFDPSGPINLAQVDAQYLRYKAFFAGDGNSTPVLYDATVNYSP